ncbi:hypothetical protein XccvBFoX7_gp81 [Xanthomonas phage FoX7]|uniref:Uncharacterized protein n=2 Tax=Carpasinavirus XcP1 TaxID=2182344 RepID=A0A858NNS3_9CAUD|nr:hypothetical protein XccvBFoX6_gp81 [Xanthomonas phage FoX6]QJB22238.1 hypothetical protein XccvBFoX7_gp81 [Xanthomonas phage FoX7]
MTPGDHILINSNAMYGAKVLDIAFESDSANIILNEQGARELLAAVNKFLETGVLE